MNYWLITTEYPPFFGGGISTYCYHTACMLSENGHRVTVFVNDKAVKLTDIQQTKEARIIRFNPHSTKADAFLGDTTQLSYAFAMILKQFIEAEGKPDIIESQDYNGIAYFFLQFRACLFDWCKGIPLLLTMHSPNFLYMEYNEVPLYKRPNFWIGEMERFSIQAADLVISPSQYLIDELKQHMEFHTPHLHVVPNPFKHERKKVLPDDTGLNNQLTFYGKLSPQKGSFAVLEKFKLLWDKGFSECFTMIGGQDIVFHPLGKTMGSIIKKQYASYIRKGLLKLKDKISPAEREVCLSGSSLFIIPSIIDNLPYTVLELMSLGKILIVSKQGGQSEIISPGLDGFVFDYKQAQSFEQTLNTVISLTKEQRRRISTNAINTIASRYNYDTIYHAKIKLVQALTTRNAGGKQFPAIRKSIYTHDISVKENNTLLSVIIPFYNLGLYLDEAVESVLKSSYTNIEILIVNDGSTDSLSRNALKKYKEHAAVQVINKDNTGLADSRNLGAEKARGGYIAFLDADDTVTSSYYEKAIRILQHYKNVHFVGAWVQYFGGSKAIWPTFNPEPPLILTHNTINSSSLVYKKEAFLSFGKNDPDFKIGLEDYESLIHMRASGIYGVAIPEILFNYRVRKGSMIKRSTALVRADYHQRIALKYDAYFRQFEMETKELIDQNGPPLSLDNATLDELPFQHIPFIKPLVQKTFRVIKANPGLKKTALQIKKIIGKQ